MIAAAPNPRPETMLGDLYRAGVDARADGDRLILDAPAGVLTADRLDAIRPHKPAVLDVLRAAGGTLPPLIADALAAFPEAELMSIEPADASRPKRHRLDCPAAVVLDRLRLDPPDPDTAADLLDAYRERMAICTIDGGLSEAEAEAVAIAELDTLSR